MNRVADRIVIPETELQEEFIRASGPGGQNVNKTSTAVQLRFDLRHSLSLPEPVRERMIRLAGRKVTAEGVLIIEASRYRTQAANRADARRRLESLLLRAARLPRPRRKTVPTRASRRRRLETKKIRGKTKRMRSPVTLEE